MIKKFYAIRVIETANPYGKQNVNIFAGEGDRKLYKGPEGKETATRICDFLDRQSRNEHKVIEIGYFKKGLEKAASC